MTRAGRIEPFRRYVREVADRMGLKDWLFHIHDEPTESSEAAAEIYPTFGRKVATIHFSDRFLDDSPEAQREIVCHELIHCHFNAACQVADRLEEVLHEVFIMEIEYGVDGLASVIARGMPLPTAPERK